MPTSAALRACPDLVLICHTPGLYGDVSRRMFDLCETLTPLVQRNSIDEGYLDLGPCGHTTSAGIEEAVHALQRRIWAELQITTSRSTRLGAFAASHMPTIPPSDTPA